MVKAKAGCFAEERGKLDDELRQVKELPEAQEKGTLLIRTRVCNGLRIP
jgi:hypothetical protein